MYVAFGGSWCDSRPAPFLFCRCYWNNIAIYIFSGLCCGNMADNEIISILENINDIGVALPPFLQPIVKNLKSQVEQKTTIDNQEDK